MFCGREPWNVSVGLSVLAIYTVCSKSFAGRPDNLNRPRAARELQV
jgi:hypothetical protein